jgi:hypothetical protein
MFRYLALRVLQNLSDNIFNTLADELYEMIYNERIRRMRGDDSDLPF